MAVARNLIVAEDAEGFYHCVSRCVRRAFLCGKDPYTGRSYEHRKAWVRNRLKKLAEFFGLEVCAYAVMSNHLHVIVRTRPDRVETWTDREIARRWLSIFPGKRDFKGRFKPPAEADIRGLAAMKPRLVELRRRLCSVSWFMRCLNENIARRANLEDDCKGRFWEGRFKCQALLDESALLACMAYVDLNPIRAGSALVPEEREFTSAYDRIQDRSSGDENKPKQAAWLSPIGEEGEPERRGLLELSLDEYLEILDWTGRSFRPGSSGAVPEHLAPILTRLGVSPERWPRTIKAYGGLFQRAVGRVESIRIAAGRLGARWLWGLSSGRKAFLDR